MAARRITKSAIDWVAFAERVPKEQKQMFQAFKSKSDLYLRKAFSLPENPPAIDWGHYKKALSPSLVEQFEKQYAAVKVSYPSENVSSEIDEQEKLVNKNIAEFIAQSKERIIKHEAELKKWENIIPFDQMTMEEYVELFPESALNPKNHQLWPPGIEDEYKAKIAAGGGSGH